MLVHNKVQVRGFVLIALVILKLMFN